MSETGCKAERLDAAVPDANPGHAAKSRLRMELKGLAFAMSRGATPEEYARFVWGEGARKWMGSNAPAADQYLLKEVNSFSRLFPWIRVTPVLLSPAEGEVLFSGGCLGGWGENRFALARSLGLNRSALCRYCAEACRIWGAQLGLRSEPRPGPGCRGGCRLVVRKLPDGKQPAQGYWAPGALP